MSELTIENLCCVCCAEDVEAAVGAIPACGGRAWTWSVGYWASRAWRTAAEDRIRAAVHGLGYRVAGDGLRPRLRSLAHTARLTPITCCTTADRMQYELPHTPVEQEHEPPVAPEHAGMGHDMSAPDMAGDMARDMRNRFLVALAFTIPVVLLSDIGYDAFGIHVVTSLDARNWLMAALSTPVVWWAGWIFIGGAATSLRHRALNMSVLVATGVLAAWLASVLLTIVGRETFYEAAVMLVTFLLFGHWMEMKARRGSSDAVQRAARPRAAAGHRRCATARQSSCPSAEVVVGDVVRAAAGRQGAGRRRGHRRAQHASTRAWSPARASRSRRAPGDEVDRRARSTSAGSLPLPGHQGRRRHGAGADRQAGRDGPELQGAGAAAGRPRRALPGDRRRSARGC